MLSGALDRITLELSRRPNTATCNRITIQLDTAHLSAAVPEAFCLVEMPK